MGLLQLFKRITLTVQQQDNAAGLVGAIRPDDLRLVCIECSTNDGGECCTKGKC